MVDAQTLSRRLQELVTHYEELMPLLALGTKEILADSLKLHTVERLFQLIVDCAISINTNIAASRGFVADDLQSTFIALGDLGVLPDELARHIATSVGLRNHITHRYGKVDLAQMLEDITRGIPDYAQYASHIDNYLANNT